jgi:hypothetical protein
MTGFHDRSMFCHHPAALHKVRPEDPVEPRVKKRSVGVLGQRTSPRIVDVYQRHPELFKMDSQHYI